MTQESGQAVDVLVAGRRALIFSSRVDHELARLQEVLRTLRASRRWRRHGRDDLP